VLVELENSSLKRTSPDEAVTPARRLGSLFTANSEPIARVSTDSIRIKGPTPQNRKLISAVCCGGSQL
jgi:hypothetical protein